MLGRSLPARSSHNQGLVFLFARKGETGISCVAGSDEALLKTGRAFFLRWPYFWEVWGREAGATYMGLEKDLAGFMASAGAEVRKTVVREAFYEFPVAPPVSEGLGALSFDQGQIRNLTVEVHFAAAADREKAREALLLLGSQQRKGVRTGVLSYPACAALTFELCHGEAMSQVVLTRTGATVSRRLGKDRCGVERLHPARCLSRRGGGRLHLPVAARGDDPGGPS